jgi:hypothetical protein
MGSYLIIRVFGSSVSVPRCQICREVIHPGERIVLKALVLKEGQLELEGYHHHCRQLFGSQQDGSEIT